MNSQTDVCDMNDEIPFRCTGSPDIQACLCKEGFTPLENDTCIG